MEALVWLDEELGAKWEVREIPDDLKAQAEEYRHELIDVLSTFDENILEKYVGDEEITVDDLQRRRRAGTIANEIVPVLNGTAFKNKGVQPLLDAIVDYLPSPIDLPPVTGLSIKGNEEVERKPSDDEPFAALAFKIMSDPHVGKLTYFRVYSGTLEKGSQVVNTTTGSKERIGRILQMHANHREDVDAVMTGDIAAGIGLKNTRTGDTLCDPGRRDHARAARVPRAGHPRGRRAEDQGRPGEDGQGAPDAVRGGPTAFQVRTDEDTGQTVISGMGELHLEVIVDRMLREFRVDATVGKPQVAYRETITQPVDKVTYTHKKQTGGSGQFAEVTIKMEPLGPGGGYEFVDKITGGRVPKEYIPAVDAGIQQSLDAGRARRATPRSTSGPPSSTASTTTSTRRRWRSRSPARWCSRRPPARPSPCCSSRSCRSRSSRPRTTWATSSATSTAAAAASAAWTSGQQPGDPGPGPPVRDVRVRYRPAVTDPGSRDLHDAVPQLPADACLGAGGDRRPSARRVALVAVPYHHNPHESKRF